jgi:hypothetical protein
MRFPFGNRRPKMKHATEEDLIPIAGLLDKIRCEKRVKERKSDVLYRRGKAFLHFHEDRRSLFADLRGPDDWERLAVNDRRGQALLLAKMLKPRLGCPGKTPRAHAI